MASIVRAVNRQWHYLFTELADERTKGFFLTGSPFIPMITLLLYYQIVKKIGPELMKNRKPFNIDRLIQVYNIFQVCICSWMAFESFRITYGPFGGYNWTCEPIDKSMSPLARRVANITWMYYMIKLIDLLDTIFFLLRKKFNQISFLHVYHHIGVTILGYVATKYYPDGQGFMLVPINSLVHSVMYAYYFLTNYNPEYKKSIWWKKYITQMQMLQFAFMTFHLGKLFFIPDCGYPWLPLFLFLPQNLFILILFGKFYRNTYLKTKSS